MKKISFVFAVLIFASAGYGQKYHPDVQAVRDVIEKWNSGYRALDPQAMAETVGDEYEIVNRFGQRIAINSRDEYVKMWNWTFTSVYNGKPGPQHNIERVRLLTPDVALVHATATRTEPVILSDGKKIPPFTQQVTFVVVKKKNGWRIASQNIHNQFADPHTSESLPWNGRDG